MNDVQNSFTKVFIIINERKLYFSNEYISIVITLDLFHGRLILLAHAHV